MCDGKLLVQAVCAVHAGAGSFAGALKLARDAAAKKRRRTIAACLPLGSALLFVESGTVWCIARIWFPGRVQLPPVAFRMPAALRVHALLAWCGYGKQCERFFSIGRKYEALCCYSACGF